MSKTNINIIDNTDVIEINSDTDSIQITDNTEMLNFTDSSEAIQVNDVNDEFIFVENTDNINFEILENTELLNFEVKETLIINSSGLKSSTGTFGYYFYTDSGNSLEIQQRQRLKIDGGGVIFNSLKLPFTDQLISQDQDGIIFQPFALNDVYTFEIRLRLIPSIINSKLTFEIDAGGTFGAIEERNTIINQDAGEETLLTYSFTVFTGQSFLDNGGKFWISSNQPIELIYADIRIFPLSTDNANLL